MAKTALIISTYNWPEALSLCFKSIKIQRVLPDEIIVADDGSTQETSELIRQFSQQISVPVKHVWQEDRGFRLARIRNLAIKNAESDYLIFIDGDIILHRDFIKDHIENRKPQQFVSGSRVLLSEEVTKTRIQNQNISFLVPFLLGKNRLNGVKSSFFSYLFSKNDTGIYNVRGCNMAFWKNDLMAINGFDERFTGWGREDSDVVYRMQKNGVKKFKLKLAAVQFHLFHKEQSRISMEKNNCILSDTIIQNRIITTHGISELP